MKLMIASDIHGSARWCASMLRAFDASGAAMLVLLGDILYHGPRNDLPDEYDPKRVIDLLSPYAAQLFCVRGNCDSEVDQMVLPFPMMQESALLFADGRKMYLTHGHHASPDALPPLQTGVTFLSGHTHVPMDETRGGIRCLNPGSVSIPKAGSAHSAILLTDGKLEWITLS